MSPLQLQRAEVIPVPIVQEQAKCADLKGLRFLAGIRGQVFAFQ